MTVRIHVGGCTTHRMTQEHEPPQVQLVHNRFEIGEIGICVVVVLGIPVGFTAATLIESNETVAIRERGSEGPPRTGESTQSVQQHDRRGCRISPLSPPEAQPIHAQKVSAFIVQWLRRHGSRVFHARGHSDAPWVDHRSPSLPTISFNPMPPRRAWRRPRVAIATASTISSGPGASLKVTEMVS